MTQITENLFIIIYLKLCLRLKKNRRLLKINCLFNINLLLLRYKLIKLMKPIQVNLRMSKEMKDKLILIAKSEMFTLNNFIVKLCHEAIKEKNISN